MQNNTISDVMHDEDLAQLMKVKVLTLRSYRSRRPDRLPPHRRIGGRICYLGSDARSWFEALPRYRSAAEAKAAARRKKRGAV